MLALALLLAPADASERAADEVWHERRLVWDGDGHVVRDGDPLAVPAVARAFGDRDVARRFRARRSAEMVGGVALIGVGSVAYVAAAGFVVLGIAAGEDPTAVAEGAFALGTLSIEAGLDLAQRTDRWDVRDWWHRDEVLAGIDTYNDALADTLGVDPRAPEPGALAVPVSP